MAYQGSVSFVVNIKIRGRQKVKCLSTGKLSYWLSGWLSGVLSELGNLVTLLDEGGNIGTIVCIEAKSSDRVCIGLKYAFVLAVVFLLVMDGLLGLCTLVPSHQHLLLRSVLVFDLCNDLLCPLLLSCKHAFGDTRVDVF